MADPVPTEYAASIEYQNHIRKSMGPKNISPEVMGQHKAMVFNAVMTGGFSINPELAAWDGYSNEKKKLIIGGLDQMDDIRYILNREDDNDILAYVITKKAELQMLAKSAAMPVK